jgi:hypothetical protein
MSSQRFLYSALISSLYLWTNGAIYVSKLENACAPAHSFCRVQRKFTIWLTALLK